MTTLRNMLESPKFWTPAVPPQMNMLENTLPEALYTAGTSPMAVCPISMEFEMVDSVAALKFTPTFQPTHEILSNVQRVPVNVNAVP